MDEKRREEKIGGAILRKIWKFIEFKSPENWHHTPIGYSCFLPNGYICYLNCLFERYNIQLHKHDITFFDFEFEDFNEQHGKFAVLYGKINDYFQEKFAKEKQGLLVRFLRESNRIGKHVHHNDRPMRPAHVKTTERQRRIKK